MHIPHDTLFKQCVPDLLWYRRANGHDVIGVLLRRFFVVLTVGVDTAATTAVATRAGGRQANAQVDQLLPKQQEAKRCHCSHSVWIVINTGRAH